MTEHDNPQQDLVDAENRSGKKAATPEDKIPSFPPQDASDVGAESGSPTPVCEPDVPSVVDASPGPGSFGQISGSEEPLLKQIRILQHDLAESARREEELIQLVNEQNRLFKTRFSQDEQKEKLIDKMHEELQKLKSDLYKNLVRPVLVDVLHIRDNMRRMEMDLKKKYPDGMIPIKAFSDYSLDLADLLEEHDVEIFEEPAGTPFIPVKQKVITRLVTNEKDLSGIIARSICSGYIYNDQVISPQRVEVYYFEDSKVQNADQHNETIRSN